VRRGGCRATDAFDSSASAAVRAAATPVGLPSRLGRRARKYRPLVSFWQELASRTLAGRRKLQ